MAHYSDDDELELQLADLHSPSHVVDEEIGDASMLSPHRSPLSSHGGSGHLQLTALYSGVHHDNEAHEPSVLSAFGPTDLEVMADPASRYGRDSGALHDELGPDAPIPNEGCCQRWRRQHCQWMERTSTRARVLFCVLLLLVLWIPVIFVLTREASQRNSGDANPPADIPTLIDHGSTRVFGVPAPWESTPPNTLIAYVGDVSAEDSSETEALFALIRDEKPQALVIQVRRII
jgi:hypothetical protein